jgi:hypothetical protein
MPCGTGRLQRVPEGEALAGRNRDLETELAGEGDAKDPRVELAKPAFGPAHEGQRVLRQVHVAAERLQHLARLGADDGDLRPLLGHVGGVDLPVPPLALQPVLHVPMDAVRPAGGGVAKERILVEPRHHAVIHEEAVLRAHQPVAAFPGFSVLIMLV